MASWICPCFPCYIINNTCPRLPYYPILQLLSSNKENRMVISIQRLCLKINNSNCIQNIGYVLENGVFFFPPLIEITSLLFNLSGKHARATTTIKVTNCDEQETGRRRWAGELSFPDQLQLNTKTCLRTGPEAGGSGGRGPRETGFPTYSRSHCAKKAG